jgi:hypothetical protein
MKMKMEDVWGRRKSAFSYNSKFYKQEKTKFKERRSAEKEKT